MTEPFRRKHVIQVGPWDERAEAFPPKSFQSALEGLGPGQVHVKLPILMMIGASSAAYDRRWTNRVAEYKLVDSELAAEKGIQRVLGTFCHQLIEADDFLKLRLFDDPREPHTIFPTCGDRYFQRVFALYKSLAHNTIPIFEVDPTQLAFSEALRWGTSDTEKLKLIKNCEEFITLRLLRHREWRKKYDKSNPHNFYPRCIEVDLVIENLIKMANLTIKPDEIWFEGETGDNPVILSIKSGEQRPPKYKAAQEIEFGLMAAGALLLKREATNTMRIGKYPRKYLPPIYAFPNYPNQQFRIRIETAIDSLSKYPDGKSVRIICEYLGENNPDRGIVVREIKLTQAIAALSKIWDFI